MRGGVGERFRTAAYASRFGRWEDLASVRRKPQRTLSADSDLYFPPELYPVVQHPLVVAKGEAVVKVLLLLRFYDYLDFTTELENLAVIPVAAKISRGRSGLQLPEQMRADAFKIVTDEAWHAQFSYDFARQLEAVTGVDRIDSSGRAPAFTQRLDRLRAQLPAEVRGVEAILFAIISETLISGVLSELPRDDRLPRAVRDLIRDHAEDEGRHHVYFRSMVKHLWPALTVRERRAIGPHIPSVVYAFLEPDYLQVATHLEGIGLTSDEIGQVIAESWPKLRLFRMISQAAAPVVRYFAEAGALQDRATQTSFEEAGLVAVATPIPEPAPGPSAGEPLPVSLPVGR